MKLHPTFVAIALAIAAASASADDAVTAYFIGNSLTMSTTLRRVHLLCADRQVDLQFGSQLSGGKSLIRHLNYKSEPNQKWTCWETNVPAGNSFDPSTNHWADKQFRFGRFDEALVKHKWDKLVMQVYASSLHDDLKAISAFIDLTIANHSAKQYYIYSIWPRRPRQRDANGKPGHIDYPAAWQAAYTAGPDDTTRAAGNNYASRSYIDALFAELTKKYPKLDIRLVPTGEVLFQLDRKIKAGELPGLAELAKRKPDMVPGLDDDTTFKDGVNVLYADAIHLNPIPHKGDTVGIFASGSTLAAVLLGQNPIGISAEPYGLSSTADAALVKAIQQTIWQVISTDPRTGVKK